MGTKAYFICESLLMRYFTFLITHIPTHSSEETPVKLFWSVTALVREVLHRKCWRTVEPMKSSLLAVSGCHRFCQLSFAFRSWNGNLIFSLLALGATVHQILWTAFDTRTQQHCRELTRICPILEERIMRSLLLAQQ